MNIWTNRSGFREIKNVGLQRGLLFGVIILTALIAFEAFNFSTTQYALSDLLGSLTFAGFRWATILSIAFCGIDFAGIARLFSPSMAPKGQDDVWYLFGAWLLAATMNAVLTWWGVSIALINHQTQSSAVIDPGVVMRAVPIVVAVMVWLIRILIIGSFSMAGDRLFSVSNDGSLQSNRPASSFAPSYPRSAASESFSAGMSSAPNHSTYRPSHRPVWPAAEPGLSAAPADNSSEIGEPGSDSSRNLNRSYSRPEPTYHEVSAAPRTTSANSQRKLH